MKLYMLLSMTKDELLETISFLISESSKYLQMFVTTEDSNIELFNIEEQYLSELCDVFKKYIYDFVNNENLDFSVESYSTSIKRENAVYLFDFPTKDYLEEMKKMVKITQMIDFSFFSGNLERVTAIYGIIRDQDHVLSFYKSISPLDKIYVDKTYMFGCLSMNNQFVKLTKSLLRISPNVQMFYVDNRIILFDIKKLEKTMNLNAVLLKTARIYIQSIKDRGLIEKDTCIENVCRRNCVCKKLIHAMTESKVLKNGLSNDELIQFALAPKWKKVINLSVNKGKTKFRMKSDAEAVRFIKLLDDDYLTSELTTITYDVEEKTVIDK